MARAHEVVEQVLSPDRAATRARLIDAAIELATEGGYDAVGMRECAARAGLSPATAYQHFSSKDRLLVAAMTRLGERSNRAVQDHHPPRGTAENAVADVFARIMREVERKPLLYQAVFRAYAAGAPGAAPEAHLSRAWPERFTWIRDAVATTPGTRADEADALATVLAYTFLGGMVAIAAGQSVDVVREVLDHAARAIVGPERRSRHGR